MLGEFGVFPGGGGLPRETTLPQAQGRGSDEKEMLGAGLEPATLSLEGSGSL